MCVARTIPLYAARAIVRPLLIFTTRQHGDARRSYCRAESALDQAAYSLSAIAASASLSPSMRFRLSVNSGLASDASPSGAGGRSRRPQT